MNSNNAKKSTLEQVLRYRKFEQRLRHNWILKHLMQNTIVSVIQKRKKVTSRGQNDDTMYSPRMSLISQRTLELSHVGNSKQANSRNNYFVDLPLPRAFPFFLSFDLKIKKNRLNYHAPSHKIPYAIQTS